MLTQDAAIAANRFGLGARPRDAAAIGSDPKGWLEEQVASAKRSAPAAGEPAGVRARAPEAPRPRGRPPGCRAGARERGPAEEGAPRSDGNGAGTASPGIGEDAIKQFGQFSREHYLEQVNERHRRAIETDQPFIERLVQFWSNHFAVSADKALVGPLVGLYEQEAIRPHVTGNFHALLLAVERHPAMNIYLDNTTSMGASSMAASLARSRGRELGLNENLAREILELHTLGVDGGYTQRDVTEFAKVITGWSIGGAIGPGARGAVKPVSAGGNAQKAARSPFGDGGKPGEFYFRPAMHEPGDKVVLGKTYKESGVAEGEQVLASLARSPATAKHLATKLARHFVADDPPDALVARLADTYLKHDGELAPVYRDLIRADESWRRAAREVQDAERLRDLDVSRARPRARQPAADHRVPERARPASVHTGLARRLARHGRELERRRRAVEAHRMERRSRQARRQRGRQAVRRRPARRVGAGQRQRRDTRRHSRRGGQWPSARAADLGARVPTR